MSTIETNATTLDSQVVEAPQAQESATMSKAAELAAAQEAKKALRAIQRAEAKARIEAARKAAEERAEAEPIIDVAAYQKQIEPTTKALVPVKQIVGNELTDEYQSLSNIFNFMRSKPKSVKTLLDDLSAKKLVNTKVIHEIINVGTLSTLSFFMTQSEAFKKDKETGMLVPRQRYTVKQGLSILERAAKSPLPLEAIQKWRAEYRYLHAVPGEVTKVSAKSI